MLDNAHEMHRYFHEAKETLMMIEEKDYSITEDLGRDQHSVSALQRHHKTFEADLKPLGIQVRFFGRMEILKVFNFNSK